VYTIGSPSPSLHERVATKVQVTASSSTVPVTLSTTGALSLVSVIVTVAVVVPVLAPSNHAISST
jgi:hypothetical protein